MPISGWNNVEQTNKSFHRRSIARINFVFKQGDSANAVPHYQKLRTRVTHIWGNRKGQPIRSAMDRPRPGRTSLMIKVSPVPGKYAWPWSPNATACGVVWWKWGVRNSLIRPGLLTVFNRSNISTKFKYVYCILTYFSIMGKVLIANNMLQLFN